MYNYNFTFKLNIKNNAFKKNVLIIKKRIKELKKLRKMLFK